MIDISDLWVGDFLKLKKSGRTGKFLGLAKDGRLRIGIGKKVVLAKSGNVELAPEKNLNQKLIDLKNEDLDKKLGVLKLEKKIDLHIENLNPNLLNALPERIIDYQLKAFEAYIANVIEQKIKFVTIIHGKGRGVLMASIHAFLSATPEVNHFIPVNNNGATEVYLK